MGTFLSTRNSGVNFRKFLRVNEFLGSITSRCFGKCTRGPERAAEIEPNEETVSLRAVRSILLETQI